MKTSLLFITLLALNILTSHVRADEKLMTVSALEHKQILQVLPEDADKRNLKRQKKAFKKGFYWTRDGIIRPLDTKEDNAS